MLTRAGGADGLGHVGGQHGRGLHFPLGVLIFGLAVMIVMMAWQEKAWLGSREE
ncbi:MAG: hypothetical protein R2848_02415 [Thermomicrobiales bacterium]